MANGPRLSLDKLPTMSARHALVLLLCALGVAACSDSTKLRKESRAAVQAYLDAHPEVEGARREALQNMKYEIGVTTKEDYLAIARTYHCYRVWLPNEVMGRSETWVIPPDTQFQFWDDVLVRIK